MNIGPSIKYQTILYFLVVFLWVVPIGRDKEDELYV